MEQAPDDLPSAPVSSLRSKWENLSKASSPAVALPPSASAKESRSAAALSAVRQEWDALDSPVKPLDSQAPAETRPSNPSSAFEPSLDEQYEPPTQQALSSSQDPSPKPVAPTKKVPPPPPPKATKPVLVPKIISQPPVSDDGTPSPAEITPSHMTVASPSPMEESEPILASVASLRSIFGPSSRTSSFTKSPAVLSASSSVSSSTGDSWPIVPASPPPPPIPPNRPSLLEPALGNIVLQDSPTVSSKPSSQITLSEPPRVDVNQTQTSPGGQPLAPTGVILPKTSRPPPPVPPPRSKSPAVDSQIRRSSSPDILLEPTPPSRSRPPIPSRTPSADLLIKPPLPLRPSAIQSADVEDLTTSKSQSLPPPPLPSSQRPALPTAPNSTAASSDTGLLTPFFAPRLPTRSTTVPVSSPPEEVWVPPLPPPLRTRTIKRETSGTYSRPASRSTSPFITPSLSQPNVDEPVLPPPPVRRPPAPSGEPIHPIRRQPSDSQPTLDPDDSDEEEDQPITSSTLSSTTSSLNKAEEYPDPTLSNRRPPVCRPCPVEIRRASSSGHHPTAFACSSGLIAVAHSQLKVYDVREAASAGSSPVLLFTMSQKETGLEIKHKDPRITALCFRPSIVEGEEARFLWCGSKDGHLWEVDVWTSSVTQVRSVAHSGPVLAILKYQSSILTIDEAGKSLLFRMNEAGHFNLHNPTHTIRIADKQTYIGLFGNQVWTSSGPTGGSGGSSTISSSTLVSNGSTNLSHLPHRHSTSHHSSTASSRRPTIRVYEPFGDTMNAPSSGGGKVLPLSNTAPGSVLCGTIISSQPEFVYFGHEGGQISVWSRGTSPSCLSVVKVAATAVVAIVGVGERLWAGSRKGVVTVYDVRETPWGVTNLWKAHIDSPVLGFEIDVGSLKHGSLTVYSWGKDDCVHAWDGLLGVDWMEGKLLEREPEFCSYRDLTVLSCSWNIDASKPAELTSTADNASFLTSVLTSENSPDIVIFGFQELIDLEDKKLQAKSLIFGKSKSKASNGDMSDKVSQRYRLWYDKLVQAVQVAMPPETPYTVIHTQNLVGLFTCIFVKNVETVNLRDVAITTVKRGMAGMFGNKGAILARFIVDDSSMCFINCHLAAGQNQKTARNADLASILDEEARFPISELGRAEHAYAGGGDGSMVLDHDLCFLQGDLNYRIDLRRENVISSLRCGEREYLLEHDQLKKEMKSNPHFRLRTFSEAPVAFDPTYKYNRNSEEYDTSEKKRVPAWCDRILFRSRVPGNIEALHYKRYEPTVSDHRPISGGFAVKVRKVDSNVYAMLSRELEERWEKEKVPFLKHSIEFYANL